MTVTPHPSYPNPTIREVICEIRFRLEEGINWHPSWYGEFFKRIEEQFTTFQPVSLPILLDVTTQLPASSAVVVPQMIRYEHVDRGVLLQLAEGRLSVHVLPKYPGWNQVLEDIQYAWNRLREVIPFDTIVRIGLRYINGIERGSQEENLGKWLITTPYIPSAVLQSKPGFVAQSSIRLDDKNRVQVILLDQSSESSSCGTFIFDIDRIAEHNISIETGDLLTGVSRLHEDVWQVFQSARGGQLESLLQGELI